MRYAVYMKVITGTNDSVNFNSAKERNAYINNAKSLGYITDIAYAPIYASGEYGKRVLVKGNLLNTI